MKALEITGGYGLDNLKLVDRPDPTPGAGQVAVRMKAVSLNFRDLLTVNGLYGGNYTLPLVPFSDGCGVIEAIGPGVKRFAVGDRVSSRFFSDTWIAGGPTPERLQGALGGPLDGCGQEVLVVSENGVAPALAHMSDEEVATLPCAALTAWRALVVDGGVRAGDTIVLQGTGGVSIFALQMAAAMGCETIITSSSDAKLERAKALGASHTINYRDNPDWSAVVRKITQGRGADLVVEVGGARTLMESLRCVRQGGHIAVIGVLSGPADPAALAMLIPTLIWTNARVQGLSVGSADSFTDMNRMLSLHRIKPVIDRTFHWTDAREALEAMQGQSHFGKIVLTF